MSSEKNQPFYVLSIDGGGARGIIPALVLRRVEERLGKRCCGTFDLIAGTSVGGIIACALSHGQHSAAEIVQTFIDTNERVFDKSMSDRLLGIVQTQPKYDGKGKRQVIVDLVGGVNTRFGKTHGGVVTVVPTYNVTSMTEVVWASDQHNNSSEDQVFAADIADATSAAPLYFPSVRVGPDEWHVDGGLFANDPTVLTVAEAERVLRAAGDYARRPIYVLSIGTGTVARPPTTTKSLGKETESFGLFDWLQAGLVGMLMDDSITSNVIAPMLMRPIDRFERVQVELPCQVELDDTSQTELLTSAVKQSIDAIDKQLAKLQL